MKLLSIETSCDETSAAVVQDGRTVLSSVVNTQIDLHRLYGGVVPEIASRTHIETIDSVVAEALEQANCLAKDVDAIAVTAWPGLIGALLVGVNFAKGLAFALNKPLVPVHHIRSHIAANYLAYPELTPPFLCLVVSGGHSQVVRVEDYTSFTVLGRTRDDAAGECFDKVARVLGLPYPGGVELDKLSTTATIRGSYHFPKASVSGAPMDFSFSGLKTAAINLLHNAEQKGEVIDKAAFAADFSDAVADALLERVSLAMEAGGETRLALAGGVCANSTLRRKAQELCDKKGATLYMPPLSLCGDNAAMVGAQGYYEFCNGALAGWALNAVATAEL